MESRVPQPGQLTKASFGYSLPLDAPLYQPFPVHYEDAEIMIFPYVTTAAAAAKLLPAQLTLAPVPGDATGSLAIAQVVFARYGFSNIGAYNEVAQTLLCTYNGTSPDTAGKALAYAVRLHVDTDVAMAAGREIGGFPKKMGRIAFRSGATYFSSLESPDGLRVCTGEMAPFVKIAEQALLPAPMQQLPLSYVSLRVMPSPLSITAPYTPSMCQLIYSEWMLNQGTIWGARGTLQFTGASALNPYHALPVVEQVPPWSPAQPATPGTALFRGRMDVSKVSILEEF
jgi:acetoacetate decarboxylase